MPFTVTNQRNNGQFETDSGETILDAAMRDNRIYPYGCRNGVCSACKCSLISGTVDYGHHEEFALTEEEKSAGKLLLCQATPLEDIVIDVEEIISGQSVQIKMLPCRVGKLERLADDVMRIFLTLPKSQKFNFLPGQYLDILMKDGKRRSFSIANLPEHSEDDGLELHIRLVKDGHFTQKVFNGMKERDLLRFEGPFGTYFLQSNVSKPIIMIAGGTGFAPIKSLIEHAMNEDPNYQIHLFWGARDEQDLYLNDLTKQWTEQYPNLKYTPVLSDSKLKEWQGATGFVHQIVSETYDDFAEFDIYASGPPIMIDSVRNALKTKGMQIEDFHFDSFEFAPQE